LATQALANLPKEENLLRWRTLAYQADALRRLRGNDEAKQAYHEVLHKFPSVLRILDVPVPVQVNVSGGEAARDAAARLQRSSRFVPGGPFQLNVDDRNGAIQICLTDKGGFQYACGGAEDKDKKMDVLAAVDGFHLAVFSPKTSLAQADLNSLDGSPVRVNADDLLHGVMQP
jgi:hypothetical protein